MFSFNPLEKLRKVLESIDNLDKKFELLKTENKDLKKRISTLEKTLGISQDSKNCDFKCEDCSEFGKCGVSPNTDEDMMTIDSSGVVILGDDDVENDTKQTQMNEKEIIVSVCEKLKDEHSLILRFTNCLNILIPRSNPLKPLKLFNYRLVPDMLSFIKNYADDYHHCKEEDILFRIVEPLILSPGPAVGCSGCNPIPIMYVEHDRARSLVKSISQKYEQCVSIESRTRKDENIEEKLEKYTISIAKDLQNYANLLSEHITKENFILYPKIDSHLNVEGERGLKLIRKVQEEFKKAEVRFGDINEKYEQYITMLEKIVRM